MPLDPKFIEQCLRHADKCAYEGIPVMELQRNELRAALIQCTYELARQAEMLVKAQDEKRAAALKPTSN